MWPTGCGRSANALKRMESPDLRESAPLKESAKGTANASDEVRLLDSPRALQEELAEAISRQWKAENQISRLLEQRRKSNPDETLEEIKKRMPNFWGELEAAKKTVDFLRNEVRDPDPAPGTGRAPGGARVCGGERGVFDDQGSRRSDNQIRSGRDGVCGPGCERPPAAAQGDLGDVPQDPDPRRPDRVAEVQPLKPVERAVATDNWG